MWLMRGLFSRIQKIVMTRRTTRTTAGSAYRYGLKDGLKKWGEKKKICSGL
jgi:hypothetical protein